VLLVPLAQALVAVPFVVRTMLPVLRGIDERLREAAATLGATPRRVWREIDLPIVSRAGLVAAGFSFAVTSASSARPCSSPARRTRRCPSRSTGRSGSPAP
jgi:ABC-type sulfate transport system permease component